MGALPLLLLSPLSSSSSLVNRQIFRGKKGKTNKWDKERKSKPSDASGTIALRNVYRGEEGQVEGTAAYWWFRGEFARKYVFVILIRHRRIKID